MVSTERKRHVPASQPRRARKRKNPVDTPLFEAVTAGVVTEIYPDKDGCSLFRLRPDGSAQTVMVKSVPVRIRVGAYVLLKGVWERDEIYGRQFAASNCSVM